MTAYNTLLKIYSYTWGDQVYMYGLEVIPSKADYGYTRGVFGNSNGDPNDDIVFRSNTNIASDSFLEGFKCVEKKEKKKLNLFFIFMGLGCIKRIEIRKKRCFKLT